MARHRSPVRTKRKSRSYSSDSRSYSRSRSRSSSPSRGALRQPPQLGRSTLDSARNGSVSNAQLNAKIKELELEVEQTKTAAGLVQKQLADALKRLKKSEAAQATYKTWLEALTGAASRVVTDQEELLQLRESLRQLEDQGNEGREDLDMFVKETQIFLEEQNQAKRVAAAQEEAQQKRRRTDEREAGEQGAARPITEVDTSEAAVESQSVFRPGIKFKLNA